MDHDILDKISRKISKFRYADAILAASDLTSIAMKDGSVESIRDSRLESISCRVLEGNAFGFSSSNQLKDWEKVVEQAARLARIKGGNVRIAEPEANHARIKPEFKKDPKNTDMDTKIQSLKEAEGNFRAGKVRNSHLIYHDSSNEIFFLNSAGAEIEEREIRTGASATFFAKAGGRIESAFDQVKRKCGYEIMGEFPEKAGTAAREAEMLLDAKAGPKGVMPVILGPELAGVLAHEAVGHACEADGIMVGSSCLEGKVGQKIGSDHVTITDSPVIQKALWGSYRFDDEGTGAKGTKLVEKGVLRGYLTSLESAPQWDGNLTGNARGDSNCRQIVRMSNTYFEKGSFGKDELFEGVGRGVYLVGCKEGQVSPKVGNFTFAAKYGYVIEKGERGRLIRDCSINGSILESLHHVEGVGKDLLFVPGTCGKDGQSAPVTTGSPHLKLGKILVG